MPTYRYRRPDGSTFEVLQKFSDAPLTEDPTTGVPVERVISGGAGLQFKGTGFYQTDYVKKPSGGAETPASGGDKAEPKPAAPKKETPKATSKD